MSQNNLMKPLTLPEAYATTGSGQDTRAFWDPAANNGAGGETLSGASATITINGKEVGTLTGISSSGVSLDQNSLFGTYQPHTYVPPTYDTSASWLTTKVDENDPTIKKIVDKLESLSDEMKELFLVGNGPETANKIKELETKIANQEVLLKEILNELQKRNTEKG